MSPYPIDQAALQAQRLGRKSWQALLVGAVGVPTLGLLFVTTIFSGPLGENGTFGGAFVFLVPFLIGFVATPMLTVTWSVGSYLAEHRAQPEADAPRPLRRLLPIAVVSLPVLVWLTGHYVLNTPW